jgi:hypothetical protein
MSAILVVRSEAEVLLFTNVRIAVLRIMRPPMVARIRCVYSMMALMFSGGGVSDP